MSRGFIWACCVALEDMGSLDALAILNLVLRWCEVRRWIVRFRFWRWACESNSEVNRPARLCGSQDWNADRNSVNRVDRQQVSIAVCVAMTGVKRDWALNDAQGIGAVAGRCDSPMAGALTE